MQATGSEIQCKYKKPKSVTFVCLDETPNRFRRAKSVYKVTPNEIATFHKGGIWADKGYVSAPNRFYRLGNYKSS